MRKIVLASSLPALALGYANGAAAAPKAAARVEPKVAVGKIEGFTPPPRPTRAGGNASKYPFDSIGVGEFFSVQGKDRRQMGSPIANANKKYRTVAKDAAGNVVRTDQEREFYAVDVDSETAAKLKGTSHEGAKVLVIRSK